MPRKTKDTKDVEIKKTTKKVTASTKSVNKVKDKSKKVEAKTSKINSNENNVKKTKNSKSSTVKKKATTKKASTTKKTTKDISIMEYYDLPYRYNKTVVKILAQTPKMLFVYWDISDEDRKAFENHYGPNFFSETKPVLIIHNETMNYSFEIEINDFANSWYLHINDANCKYEIELGRRPLPNTSNIQERYIYISSSNKMDAPNNHILFENFNTNVVYKNTKTGNTSIRDFSILSNLNKMQKIYNIYDLYKKIYKDDLFSEVNSEFSNPSSIFKPNLHKGEKYE